MLVRLAAGPLVGILADLLGSLRLLLATCAALAAATAAAFLLANTFWLLFLIALVQAAALTPTTSIADALSVNAAKPEIAGKPFEYGWIRGSGSAAFVLGTLVIGQLVSHDDLTPIIWMNVALLAAAAGATALLPRVTIQSAPHDGPPVLADLRELLRISRFRVLVLMSALVYGRHAMHDAFAAIRWSAAGIDTSIISVLWSEAVAAEVIVFFLVGPALLDRFGARGAAALAAATGIIRWSIEGVSTSVLVLSILQPLHGLTFALLHLACMRMMASLVPSGTAGTAQTLYAFGSALATAALTLLSGILYARFGATAFFPMALLCGVALPCAWFGLSDIRDRSTDGA
jgi:PPP family 3-phenylpropionic acid transporter